MLAHCNREIGRHAESGLVGARKHANDPEVDVVGDAESGTPRGQEGSMPFIETAGS